MEALAVLGFLRKNWQGLLGLILGITLGSMLLIQKGETRHWRKQSNGFEQLYHREQAAFAQTVTNYRAAADAARAADKAHADRVLAEQAAINKERDASYEARIADARARAERAERLRQAAVASAHPGSPGAAPVPGSVPAAGGPNGPAPQVGLSPDDALIATEQAIQLDELERWVKGNLGINRTGPDSSSSSPSGNR
jgi:hypothetical protein